MALDFIGSASQPFMGALTPLLRPFRPSLSKVTLPLETAAQPPTSRAVIEECISSLQGKKAEWANLDLNKKADLFKSCSAAAYQATEEGARLTTDARGSYGQGRGEERISLLSPITAFREYAESLYADGQPKPKRLTQHENGQYIAEVFPTGYDSIFFGGFKGEIWIKPGEQPTQGTVLRGDNKGSLALVLGAGNQLPVVILDIAHMLLVENSVVICKMNPILDYMKPYIEKAVGPLIEAGYVRIVYGGAEQGKILTQHQAIDKIHLTGSAATYDAIVWQGKPKVGNPPLNKQITAELGCVTPCIVTPGTWSKQAIAYHAAEVVSGLVNNAGHNCCKLELLITAKDWPQRQEFMEAVKQQLASTPCKVAWYPGSAKKHAAFKAKFSQAVELGSKDTSEKPPEGYVSWALAENLTPEKADLETENWCGVLQEVALPGTGDNPTDFLSQAVAFANDRCWGSLSCSLIAPPETSKTALDTAIADLKYGAIAVNLPTFCVFGFTKLSWGAFPGNSPQDIESGMGSVHNTMLFDHPQKSVIRAPWVHHPTHLWSPNVRNLDRSSYYVTKFAADQSLLSLNIAAFHALRG